MPDLNSIVTASLDTTCNVIDLERMTLKRKFDAHQKAVYSFAWCSHSKVVASCGLEHNIYLWSPYSERVVGTLTGHSSAVRKVVYNDQDNKLISLGADNTGASHTLLLLHLPCLTPSCPPPPHHHSQSMGCPQRTLHSNHDRRQDLGHGRRW